MDPASDMRASSHDAAVNLRRQMSHLAMLGAIAGLIVTMIGIVLLLAGSSRTHREIAVMSMIAPVVLYVAWWVFGSGFWRDQPSAQDGSDRAASLAVAQVFDTSNGAGSSAEYRSTISRDAVEGPAADTLRSSLGIRQGSDPATRAELRPRRTS